MIPEKIDHRHLKNLTDVRIARERLKYGLALEEKAVSESIAGLGDSIVRTVRSAAYSMGVKLAYALVVNLLQRRKK